MRNPVLRASTPFVHTISPAASSSLNMPSPLATGDTTSLGTHSGTSPSSSTPLSVTSTTATFTESTLLSSAGGTSYLGQTRSIRHFLQRKSRRKSRKAIKLPLRREASERVEGCMQVKLSTPAAWTNWSQLRFKSSSRCSCSTSFASTWFPTFFFFLGSSLTKQLQSLLVPNNHQDQF